jgi:chromosome segregation ATPase
MDLNPLTQRLASLREQAKRKSQVFQQICRQIEDYESQPEQRLIQALNDHVDAWNRVDGRLRSLFIADLKARDQLRDVESAIGSLLNPFNWFDDEQDRLRNSRDALFRQLKESVAQIRSLSSQLAAAKDDWKLAKERLDWFRSFDISSARGEQEILSRQCSQLAGEIEKLERRSAAVDHALRPHIDAINDIERNLDRARSRRLQAEAFQQRLDKASTSYERKRIHDECERVLGTSNPRKAQSEIRPQIERLERDLEKSEARARSTARDASLEVGSIVIDGSNMCFTSAKQFIGLAVLQKVVPDLSSTYAMIVVFDASIRRRLRLDDKSIRDRLGHGVQVHVMPSKEGADETILDLAGVQSDRFVLSNDRYGDFCDKAAVSDGRILTHEIVDGRVFIRSLKYEAFWKP